MYIIIRKDFVEIYYCMRDISQSVVIPSAWRRITLNWFWSIYFCCIDSIWWVMDWLERFGMGLIMHYKVINIVYISYRIGWHVHTQWKASERYQKLTIYRDHSNIDKGNKIGFICPNLTSFENSHYWHKGQFSHWQNCQIAAARVGISIVTRYIFFKYNIRWAELLPSRNSVSDFRSCANI